MSVGVLKCLGIGAIGTLVATASAHAVTCESLAGETFSDVAISSATSMAPGFTAKSALGREGVTIARPFCRITAYLSPVPNSKIGFEVWLPEPKAWNRKYFGSGNGGWTGAFAYQGISGPLARGYAVMTTDQGHTNDPANPVEDVTWALGHPERVVDFAYRAEHVATVAAKSIVARYYGIAPEHSYFSGCSAGGGQGVVESLRYPADYDGYIYGASGPDHLARETGGLWDVLAASLADPVAAIQPEQLALVHKTIVAQCAGKDGGLTSDRFLSNPAVCHPDLRALTCKPGAATTQCLSPQQIASFEKIYRGPNDPRTEQSYEAGFSAGSELGWALFTGKKNPAGVDRPWAGFFADIVFGDPDYLSGEKYLQFNFNSDYRAMVAKDVAGGKLGDVFASDKGRSLDPVRAAGGKIIAYHGWEDGDAPTMVSVEMYKEMVAREGGLHHLTPQAALALTRQFYRLYLVPGLGHCRGGDGPWDVGQPPHKPVADDAQHDMLTALEKWVEQGTPPDYFVGAHPNPRSGGPDSTRPVCPYPSVAHWKGTGDASQAVNFACGTF